MSHSLIQQTKEKRRQVFGVVKERIVTTQPSSVIEEVQQTGALGGLLSLCGPKALKVQGTCGGGGKRYGRSHLQVNMEL